MNQLTTKNLFMYSLFIFVFIFLVQDVSATTCTYSYSYSQVSLNGNKSQHEYVTGTKLEYDTSTNIGKVTEYNDAKMLGFIPMNFTFGGSRTLDNWNKESCPMYMVLRGDGSLWLGFDEEPDLSPYVTSGNEFAYQGMHIFINNDDDTTYTCTYTSNNFYIKFDKEGKAILAEPIQINPYQNEVYRLDENLTTLPAEEPGVCENVYRCTLPSATQTDDVSPTIYYELFSNKGDFEENKNKCLGSSGIFGEVIPSKNVSEEGGDNDTCRTFTAYKRELEENWNYCSVNSASCTIYSNYKNKIKSWCNSVISNTDYNYICLTKCLALNELISDIEGKNGTNSQCGFSDNLLGFIRNIVKWVKYLIPAIIIILSILDFIKAIGSDKEDEMKKAQHKLVIRLIVAVLIFIIPFIIEFILDKMGFFAEGCGIIDF